MNRINGKKPVLVTGATGFIGWHLVDRLVSNGYSVRALVRKPTDYRTPSGTVHPAVTTILGSLTDHEAVVRAAKGVGTIFHLAARVRDWGSKNSFMEVARDGTETLLRAAAFKYTPVVTTSSMLVYGDRLREKDRCDEEMPLKKARGNYSLAKQAQEDLARRYALECGVPITVLRPANVYGPGSRLWVGEVLKTLRSRRPAVVGEGKGNAHLCHVGNLVDCLLLAMNSVPNEPLLRVYNVWDDEEISWKRYFSDLAEASNSPSPVSISPFVASTLAKACPPLWGLRNWMLKFQGRPPVTKEALLLATARAQLPTVRVRKELGFKPRISYSEGIAQLRTYLRERRAI